MSRPEVIPKGPPPPPFFRRARIRAARWWDEYRLARAKARYRREAGKPDETLVAFIVGCQRSGTNMLIRTLGRSLEVDRFDEDAPRAFIGCRIKDHVVRDRLIGRSTAKCVLFKPICDSHRLLDLFREHPKAKALWIYRHYAAVAHSAVAYWGDTSLRFMRDLLAGGGDWGTYQWNREGVTDAVLTRMREAAATAMTPNDAAALFWYMRNQTFFDQSLEHHPDVLLIRYEDLVSHPQPEFARASAFLGIHLDPATLAAVHARSLVNRKPAITPGVIRVCDDMLARLDGVLASRKP